MNFKKSVLCPLLYCLVFNQILFAAINSDKIGIYFWDGKTKIKAENNIAAGYLLLKRLGTHSIRITMSPRSNIDYRLGKECIEDFTLTRLAQRQDFNKFFSDPQFSTIMITAYDRATDVCLNNRSYLNPDLYNSLIIRQVQEEYRQFASYLGSNFPDKKFIIGHWEGDDAVYCASSYSHDYENCPQSVKNMVGLILWLNARNTGIKLAGVKNVYSAVEFNSVRILRDKNLPDLLNNVIPFVNADYFSYSAYESTGPLDLSNKRPDIKKFIEDVAEIKRILAKYNRNPDNLIIGELGFTHNGRKKIRNKLKITFDALDDSSVKHIFVWNLLDVGGNFALFYPDGKITPSGKYLKRLFQHTANN